MHTKQDNTSEPFVVGGTAFSAVRKMLPRPHWLLRIDETGEVLGSGAGGISNDSVPKMQASLEQMLERVSHGDVIDFRARFGLHPVAPRERRAEQCRAPDEFNANVDAATRMRFAAFSTSRHNGWMLCVHEPWKDSGKSRIVLINAVFMAHYEYETGDEQARNDARMAAIGFAVANRVVREELAGYRYWRTPYAVAYTKVLGAAGWVTGDAAKQINERLEPGTITDVARMLDKIGDYIPTNHSETVLGLLQKSAVQNGCAQA